MKAVVYHEFGGPLSIETVPDPTPPTKGVVLNVQATGLCRSDWHGWRGNDPDILLPHVPGHELAGIIVEIGKEVCNWQKGDRVTLPFVCGCGSCSQCHSGNHQVCDQQFQPGFTHWGSFAQYVAIDYADVNLVRLPESMEFTTAASLGCRFVTSFRGVVDQGKVTAGQWVAVHGCGGVGLSAIMIASAMGARVIAIDIAEDKLNFAKTIGADVALNANQEDSIVDAIKEITSGGVHVSIDALGSSVTCINSILGLRKRGKHIQIGLMAEEHSHPSIPMGPVIANELELIGSHGMQAFRYSELLGLIEKGKLKPEKLIGRCITLEESGKELTKMNQFQGIGVTVINRF